MFKEKKVIDLESLRAHSNIHSKKKENRKSARTSRITDKKKSTSVKESEKLVEPNHSISLEEIVQSFQRELNYQNELLEHMKEDSVLLKRKIHEETEKCKNIMEDFETDITALRKSTQEERKERRQLQQILENFQSTLNITSQAHSINLPAFPPAGSGTGNSSSTATSKPKTKRNKKKQYPN